MSHELRGGGHGEAGREEGEGKSRDPAPWRQGWVWILQPIWWRPPGRRAGGEAGSVPSYPEQGDREEEAAPQGSPGPPRERVRPAGGAGDREGTGPDLPTAEAAFATQPQTPEEQAEKTQDIHFQQFDG